MSKKLRQIITYDSFLGHKYVPATKVRVRYGKGAYFIHTDTNGFRNSPDKQKGKVKLVALGDSYTAGDGVSNEDRYTNIIESRYDCEVYNMGVSGYGVDQQILAYERYKDFIEHEAILFFPNLDDLKRNLLKEREGIDQTTGGRIMIPKPYFILKGSSLELQNIPVPRERSEILKSDNLISNPSGQKYSFVNRKYRAAGFYINQYINYQLLNKQEFPELSDPSSPEWQLMDKLIVRLLELAGGKPVFITPLPYNSSVANKEKSLFLQIFRRYEKKHRNIIVMDVVKTLQEHYSAKNDSIFLPICGHYTRKGNELIARVVSDILSKKLNIRKRADIPAKTENKDIYTMGLSCFYHDSAAAILKNGKIIAAAQEERFTRIKHDKAFPENAVNYCLEQAGIDINELKGICYYDNESWTLERILHSKVAIGEKGEELWARAQKSMIPKLKIGAVIRDKYDYKGKLYKTEHHISHASSAYYASPFDNAAILVIDGVGEWACSSIGEGTKKEGIKILKQQYYPHSLGLLYSAVTSFCGFKVNSGEYKLMGLAPYGEPVYADLIKNKLVDIKEDGSVFINQEYFAYLEGEEMTNEKFNMLFNSPPRQGESRITKREMDLAASLQQVTEEIIIKMAGHAHKITGQPNLVMAGGVALNCVANGKLYEKTPFRDFFFQPASGDAGGAMGAAFDLYYQFFEKEKKTESIISHSYLGPDFSGTEIEAFLHTKGISHHRFDRETREKTIAAFASSNKVIGYFDGRMEFGPRALGGRSIIANPLSAGMQSKLNLKIKYRESFRPFAPIYAEDDTAEYFDFDKPSPYMLVVRPVKENLRTITKNTGKSDDLIKWVNEPRSKLPAITHVDYSARLQSVNEEQNPSFYKILKEFKKLTGYSVLINTSFNVRGEPIVCTPEDAYKCFMRTNMDILVLGDHYLLKEEQPEWKEKEEWEKLFMLD